MRRSQVTLVVVTAALLVAAGCQPGNDDPARILDRTLSQESYRDVPVVVLVFDEFPLASLLDDEVRIDAKLFPNFARLAEDSYWFRNTVTVGTFTVEALPALMTGSYPDQIPAPHGATYPHNLFTLLGDAYDVIALEDFPAVCTPRFCRDSKPPPGPETAPLRAFAQGPRGGRFTAFVQSLDARGEPALFFTHLVLPHAPWRFLPTGQAYPSEQPVPGEVDTPGRGRGWSDNRWLVAQAYQRHLLQVQLADSALGVVVAKLKELGIYDETLLVIAADHGLGFVPGYPKRRIRKATAGHLAPVPFFLKRPHQADGYISDAPLQVVDIVPTIADVLELSQTWPDMDGVSAFSDDIPRDRSRYIQSIEIHPRGAQLSGAVDEKYEIFGDLGGALRVFGLEPPGGNGLVGRPLTDVPIGDEALVAAELDVQLHIDAAFDASYVPVRMRGRLSGDPGGLLVVGVNGRVAAVTRSYKKGHFQAMFSPRFIEEPPNRVELFTYLDGVLHPVRVIAPELQTDGGATTGAARVRT